MKIGFALLGVYFLVIGLSNIPTVLIIYIFGPDSSGTVMPESYIWASCSQAVAWMISGLVLMILASKSKAANSNATPIDTEIVIKIIGLYFVVDSLAGITDGVASLLTSSFDINIALMLFLPPVVTFLAGMFLLYQSSKIVKKIMYDKSPSS